MKNNNTEYKITQMDYKYDIYNYLQTKSIAPLFTNQNDPNNIKYLKEYFNISEKTNKFNMLGSFVADGVRFELTEGVNPRRFSRPVL